MLRCPRGSPFTGERRTSAPVQLWPNLGLDVCSCCRCCLLPAPADADTETAAAAPRRNNAPDASAKVPSRKGSTSVRRTVIKTFVVDCTPPLPLRTPSAQKKNFARGGRKHAHASTRTKKKKKCGKISGFSWLAHQQVEGQCKAREDSALRQCRKAPKRGNSSRRRRARSNA